MYKTEFNGVEKVWSGIKDDIHFNKELNFGELILAKLSDTNDDDRVLQIDGDTGETLMKADIRRQTIRCAQNLLTLGCSKDQRIAIIARNHHSLTPLLFASICIGSPVCPLDVDGDGNAKILERIEPSFVFCDSDVLSTVQKIVTEIGLNVKLFTVNEKVTGYESIDSLIEDNGEDEYFVCTKIEDAYSHAAVITCSSGTTGLSKSICLSHAVFNHFFYKPTPFPPFVSLCFSSLYWCSGVFAILNTAFKGCRVFTAKPFSTDIFLDLLDKYKIQFFTGAPCQVQAILKSERCKTADLSSLLACLVIGSQLPSALSHSMRTFIPKCLLMTGYGSTEIAGGVTAAFSNDLIEHPSTAGYLIRGVQMKIINENTNERCGISEEGEVYVKTTIPAMGYFRDEVANRSAFDEEGYFITGDIGYFDEAGRLFISGRKKEMFKVRGFVIWPSEIEDVILKNHAVRYACVINVYDDGIASDLAAAVIVRNEQYTITKDEICKLVTDRFANYKRLEGGVYFVDELPMTPSGKVIRAKVKKIAQHFYEIEKQNLEKL